MSPSVRFLAAPLAAVALAQNVAWAVDDAPPVNTSELLQQLQAMKETQASQYKSVRQRAAAEAAAAAANPARAAELWEEAVRATQFQGAAKEGAQFREWREKEGAALREREVQMALRLYFNWLSLTLQRANGTETRDLLNAVMGHVREVIADQAAIESFEESAKQDAANVANPRRAGAAGAARDREKVRDANMVKRMYDQIVKTPVNGGPYAEWLRLGDVLRDVAPAGGGGGGRRGGGGGGNAPQQRSATGWESTPGNIDGIYNNIIMPELRAAKDPRVLEYWDYCLRHEAEQAGRSKLSFEIDKFNQVRRPQLLWSRSRELANIGLKNRAATDMFGIIKANPNHASVANWISELETLLNPPAAATATPASAPPPAP